MYTRRRLYGTKRHRRSPVSLPSPPPLPPDVRVHAGTHVLYTGRGRVYITDFQNAVPDRNTYALVGANRSRAIYWNSTFFRLHRNSKKYHQFIAFLNTAGRSKIVRRTRRLRARSNKTIVSNVEHAHGLVFISAFSVRSARNRYATNARRLVLFAIASSTKKTFYIGLSSVHQ